MGGPPGPRAEGFDHDHAVFDRVLSKYVSQGRVDYAGLAKDRGGLDEYVESLSRAPGEPEWTRSQRLAFWINAYNALTLQAIVDHYPIRKKGDNPFPENSIRQIEGVWDEIRWTVAGRRHTLNEIEREILRAELDEPRIHFAIVCASIGCPPMPAHAFRSGAVEDQLETAARQFVRSDQYVRIDAKRKKTEISKIFQWFHDDFDGYLRNDLQLEEVKKEYRGVMSFLYDRLEDPAHRAFVARGGYEIEFLEYDWSLNERKSPDGGS